MISKSYRLRYLPLFEQDLIDTANYITNILKKLTYSKSNFFFIFISAFLLFITSGWQKNYNTSLMFTENFLNYFFFILVFVISMFVLLLAFIKKKFKRWLK